MENKTNKCKFCDRTYSTRSNLVCHQRTAKFCLKIQGKHISKNTLICFKCKTVFTQRHRLEYHIQRCREDYDDMKQHVAELRKRVDDYDKLCQKVLDLETENDNLKTKYKKLKRVASQQTGDIHYKDGKIDVYREQIDKPSTVNNSVNYVNAKLASLPVGNVPALTEQHMENVIQEHYTLDKFKKGVYGLTDLISIMITHEGEGGEIERNYVCTDISRNKFHRLLESKEWKEDNGASVLHTVLDKVKNPASKYAKLSMDKVEKAIETNDPDLDWIDKEGDKDKNHYLAIRGGTTELSRKERDELVRHLRKNISSEIKV